MKKIFFLPTAEPADFIKPTYKNMRKKNTNNKDLYIFFVSVALVFMVSVAMLSLLRLTSLYFISKKINNKAEAKNEILLQEKTIRESIDPLIIPAKNRHPLIPN